MPFCFVITANVALCLNTLSPTDICLGWFGEYSRWLLWNDSSTYPVISLMYKQLLKSSMHTVQPDRPLGGDSVC